MKKQITLLFYTNAKVMASLKAKRTTLQHWDDDEGSQASNTADERHAANPRPTAGDVQPEYPPSSLSSHNKSIRSVRAESVCPKVVRCQHVPSGMHADPLAFDEMIAIFLQHQS